MFLVCGEVMYYMLLSTFVVMYMLIRRQELLMKVKNIAPPKKDDDFTEYSKPICAYDVCSYQSLLVAFSTKM